MLKIIDGMLVLQLKKLNLELSLDFDLGSLLIIEVNLDFCEFSLGAFGIVFNLLWNAKEMNELANVTFGEMKKEVTDK